MDMGRNHTYFPSSQVYENLFRDKVDSKLRIGPNVVIDLAMEAKKKGEDLTEHVKTLFFHLSCYFQLAKMVQKHFQELEQKELRAEKEESMKLKRIAGQLAKMVKEFWSNIEKVGKLSNVFWL